MAKSPLLLPLTDSSLWQQESLFTTSGQSVVSALWLAITLPKFSIELPVLSAGNAIKDRVIISVEKVNGQAHVHTVSDNAELYGINSGMKLNAAYALCPALDMVEYNPGQQYQQLEKLTVWAGQFTSKISIADDSTLLLEVMGSVKLFGGLLKLCQLISDRFIQSWPYTFNTAISPSPLASVLLAKSYRDQVIIEDKEALRSRLGEIPLNNLSLPKKTKIQLGRLGLHILRDLWRLPRKDLARRYGKKLNLYLDQLVGVVPDVQQFYQKEENFSASWTFADETKDSKIVTHVVTHLLEKLVRFLVERDACISEYQVHFQHRKKIPTILIIRMRQPIRDLGQFLLLFEECLQRSGFSQSVISVWVVAKDLEGYTSQTDVLLFSPDFKCSEMAAEYKIDDLLDIFQVRLGLHAIKTLHLIADHRPEYAYCYNENQPKSSITTINDRPLWLLPMPRYLGKRPDALFCKTVENIISGPERIESGWWSEQDIRRDYYIAQAKNGQRLWIYQELIAPCQWYIHGFFA